MHPEHHYLLNFGEIFTLFFVMLGPLRVSSLDLSENRKLAIQTGALAWLVLVIAGILGILVLSQWHIEPPVLLLSGGIIFFLTSLLHILGSKPPPQPAEDPPTASDLALRVVISPYGMVGVIVLLSASHDLKRSLMVVGALTAVMLLNTLSMAFGHRSVKKEGRLPFRIVSTILNTLQLGLALQLIVDALRFLLPP